MRLAEPFTDDEGKLCINRGADYLQSLGNAIIFDIAATEHDLTQGVSCKIHHDKRYHRQHRQREWIIWLPIKQKIIFEMPASVTTTLTEDEYSYKVSRSLAERF